MSLGLDRVREALDRLGAPHARLPAVHIAGTNGKGSTAAMTEAILRAAGLRTGLFTSPHLCRFTERIRLCGQEVDGDHLALLDERLQATGVPLTYFEVSAVLAFLSMAEAAVDVAVLETGLGGRLDATNVCAPIATAITSIGRDHTEWLGDTLGAIAGEKAGIAKPGAPLFLGPLPEEALAAITATAARVGAPTRRFGIDFGPTPIPPGLPGDHQRTNAAMALALAQEASRALGRTLPEAAVTDGLAHVHWPGRMERVTPGVILDGAHNEDGARALVAALPPGRPRVLVASVVRGKDAGAMLAVLAPAFDRIVFTRSRNERSSPPEELAALGARLSAGADIRIEPNPAAALAEARRAAGSDGLVVVAGSLFLVGEVRADLLGEAVDPVVGGDPLP